MKIHRRDTALVVIDPQNDVLSSSGLSWPLVEASVRENGTIEHLGQLFRSAASARLLTVVSPHFLYPFDQGWHFGGAMEKAMLDGHEFARPDPGHLAMPSADGTGADWLDDLKPFIENGETVVVSPHKAWGPQSNDLVFQLRKRGIQRVLLAGMLANLCVESHLRDLIEQGFEVAVVRDATAGPRHPELGDGYAAALVNFHFVANEVLLTSEAVDRMTADAEA